MRGLLLNAVGGVILLAARPITRRWADALPTAEQLDKLTALIPTMAAEVLGQEVNA